MTTYQKYAVSEIFGDTIQGEGHFTGVPTVWIRFFSCNFKCLGFGQAHLPREQWKDPANEIDLSNIKSFEELPVFPYGCDSAYSHYKKYRELAPKYTVNEIVSKLTNLLTNEFNPRGKFLHPISNQDTHLAFTGGEPMLQQRCISKIMNEFENRLNTPYNCTVETNGTQEIRYELIKEISYFVKNKENSKRKWFWSCSPKLSASGEKWEEAIKPKIVKDYFNVSKYGQLKFVVDGSKQVWEEVDTAIHEYRKEGITWPVWIMPVGATEEQQEFTQADICEQTVKRGYNFSARVHCWVFGNVVGK